MTYFVIEERIGGENEGLCVCEREREGIKK
jgi:hypothetical protein